MTSGSSRCSSAVAALVLTAVAGPDDALSWHEYATVVLAAMSLVIAVVLGALNRATAMRALKLSERQEARRDSRLDVHVNDSVAWRRSAATEHRLVGFHVLITNPTDRASSVVRAELHVTFGAETVVTTVKVPHNSERMHDAPAGIDPIELPARLDANGALTGWLLFHIEDGLTGGHGIDRYDAVVRDVHGIEETVQVTLVREVVRDETT